MFPLKVVFITVYVFLRGKLITPNLYFFNICLQYNGTEVEYGRNSFLELRNSVVHAYIFAKARFIAPSSILCVTNIHEVICAISKHNSLPVNIGSGVFSLLYGHIDTLAYITRLNLSCGVLVEKGIELLRNAFLDGAVNFGNVLEPRFVVQLLIQGIILFFDFTHLRKQFVRDGFVAKVIEINLIEQLVCTSACCPVTQIILALLLCKRG